MREAVMAHNDVKSSHRQRGASAVEFAFIVVMFLTLLFGIVEFGRLFFNINSVQEITRRAAREQVVRWVSATGAVQREAVLQPGSTGTVYYPGAIDINNTQVRLSFYNTYADAASGTSPISYSGSATPQSNFNNCLLGNPTCVRFVRATLSNSANPDTVISENSPVNFNVFAAFMPSNVFPLPNSTVIMPAEALGLL